MRKPKSHEAMTGWVLVPATEAGASWARFFPVVPRISRRVGMSIVIARLGAWRRQPGRSDGQGLAEYALILALIAIIAIVALIFLGGQVSAILSQVGASV